MFFQNDRSAGSSCLSAAGADAAGADGRLASTLEAFWAAAVLAMVAATRSTAAMVRGACSDISRSLSCEIVRVSVQPEDGPSLPERKLSALRVWHPNFFNADQTETADAT